MFIASAPGVNLIKLCGAFLGEVNEVRRLKNIKVFKIRPGRQ